MLPIVKMVADIFIDSGEFEAAETLLIETRHLYMTDKSCKVVFDEIRATLQQKRINNTNDHAKQQPTQENPPTEPKVVLVVEKEKKIRTITEPQTQRTTRKQIVLTNAGHRRPEKEEGRGPTTTTTTTEQTSGYRREARASHPTAAAPPPPPRLTTSSVAAKPKRIIQWYLWENGEMETGAGFNREPVVKGERAFRVDKPKRV